MAKLSLYITYNWDLLSRFWLEFDTKAIYNYNSKIPFISVVQYLFEINCSNVLTSNVINRFEKIVSQIAKNTTQNTFVKINAHNGYEWTLNIVHTLSLTLIYPDFWQLLFVFQINPEFRVFYLFSVFIVEIFLSTTDWIGNELN